MFKLQIFSYKFNDLALINDCFYRNSIHYLIINYVRIIYYSVLFIHFCFSNSFIFSFFYLLNQNDLLRSIIIKNGRKARYVRLIMLI